MKKKILLAVLIATLSAHMMGCNAEQKEPNNESTTSITASEENSSSQDGNKEDSKEQSPSNETNEKVSRECRNALAAAKNYNSFTPMSEKGFREQLAYEGYEPDAIDYAINNLNADYNKNALLTAKNYESIAPMSLKELKEQLLFEGYSESQAQYAIDNLEK